MYNYPNKRAPYTKAKISTSNRGMLFEDMINESNRIYLEKDIAVIYKKPTPVQIVNVDYPMRSMAKINEAYYKTPSTTDYNGVYKGYYIDFDAKQTNSETSFPLSNISYHQFRHLEAISRHGGIGFILVYFKELSEIFLYDAKSLLEAENEANNGGRKSIPYSSFKEKGILIKESYPLRVPYLDAVDILINKIKCED